MTAVVLQKDIEPGDSLFRNEEDDIMSFSIALSGLNASNSELNTISNNIANVSTSGFKESRTEFASVYSGSEAGGVEVVGVSQNFEKSGTVTGTGRSLDMP